MKTNQENEYQKDYSKLRPFDLDAAKNGEEICFEFNATERREFIAEHNGKLIVDSPAGIQIVDTRNNCYRMKPPYLGRR